MELHITHVRNIKSELIDFANTHMYKKTLRFDWTSKRNSQEINIKIDQRSV